MTKTSFKAGVELSLPNFRHLYIRVKGASLREEPLLLGYGAPLLSCMQFAGEPTIKLL